MKTKNLILLIVALIVLGGIQLATRKSATKGNRTEKPVKLVDFDINAADRIEVQSAGTTAILSKAAGNWVVDNRWGFPAEFATISAQAGQLAAVEGLEVRGGEKNTAEFGLDASATNATDLVRITFTGNGKSIGTVLLGSPRLSRATEGGFPQGGYVRAGEGPVLLTENYLSGFPRRPEDWADRNLVNLSRPEIQSIRVTPKTGTTYTISSDTNGALALDGLGANEQTKQEAVEAVAGALQSLSWSGLLDPKTPPAETGLDQADRYEATLSSGLRYTVSLGLTRTQENGRVVSVDVAYARPTPPVSVVTTNADGSVTDTLKMFEAQTANDEKRAGTEHARLSPWIFVVPDYTASQLTKSRADLIQAQTNTPAPAATITP